MTNEEIEYLKSACPFPCEFKISETKDSFLLSWCFDPSTNEMGLNGYADQIHKIDLEKSRGQVIKSCFEQARGMAS